MRARQMAAWVLSAIRTVPGYLAKFGARASSRSKPSPLWADLRSSRGARRDAWLATCPPSHPRGAGRSCGMIRFHHGGGEYRATTLRRPKLTQKSQTHNQQQSKKSRATDRGEFGSQAGIAPPHPGRWGGGEGVMPPQVGTTMLPRQMLEQTSAVGQYCAEHICKRRDTLGRPPRAALPQSGHHGGRSPRGQPSAPRQSGRDG